MINIFYSQCQGFTDGLLFYCFELMCILLDNNKDVNLVVNGDINELILILKSKYIIKDIYIKNIKKYNFEVLENLFIYSPIILNNIHQDVLESPIKYKNLFDSQKNVKYVVFAKNKEFHEHSCRFLKHNYTTLSDNELYGTNYQNFYKKIYFNIYKPVNVVEYRVLFNGASNMKFQNAYRYWLKSNIKNYIFLSYISKEGLNNTAPPVKNLMEKFDKYYYCKDFFDEAPRFIQECFYYNKKIIYDRPVDFKDGGYLYYQRGKDNFNFNLSIDDLCAIL